MYPLHLVVVHFYYLVLTMVSICFNPIYFLLKTMRRSFRYSQSFVEHMYVCICAYVQLWVFVVYVWCNVLYHFNPVTKISLDDKRQKGWEHIERPTQHTIWKLLQYWLFVIYLLVGSTNFPMGVNQTIIISRIFNYIRFLFWQ